MRINTNPVSLMAQRTLGKNSREQASTLNRLSSGNRITQAKEDAAGLAISEKLKAQIRGLGQAERNTNDAISMIQVAEGGLAETSNILVRMRELSVQAASDTIGEREKGFTNLEYMNLKKEIERIAQVTEFNGRRLINGNNEQYDFQVGINNDDFQDRIEFNTSNLDASTEGLRIADSSVGDKEGALESLEILDEAIQMVAGQRAELGANQNRLASTVNNIQVNIENLSSANSRIRDADYAVETAKNTKYDILTTAGAAVLSQANTQGKLALKLIG